MREDPADMEVAASIWSCHSIRCVVIMGEGRSSIISGRGRFDSCGRDRFANHVILGTSVRLSIVCPLFLSGPLDCQGSTYVEWTKP